MICRRAGLRCCGWIGATRMPLPRGLRHVRIPDERGGSQVAPLVAEAMLFQAREMGVPVDVAIFNAATGKADRVGIKVLADGKRTRVFKSSGEEIKVA